MSKPSRSKQVAWALALLTGALAAGCAPDCDDLCEDALECAGATEAEAEAEEDGCTRQCQDAVAQAEVTGCEDRYEDYFDCAAYAEDVCTAASACDAEASAWSSCVAAYCSGNPDDLACRDLPGT